MKQLNLLPEATLDLIASSAITDPERLIDQLSRFKTTLLKVNQKINLVSRQNSEAVADHSFYDSIALLQLVNPKPGERLLDLGSGAGFPGLVIAAAVPAMRVISVEANRRKVEFQRQVVRELGLENVELLCARIEALSPLLVDSAIAKAFSSVEQAVALIAPHLRSGGSLFLPRSLHEDPAAVDWERLRFKYLKALQYQSGTDKRYSQLIHTKKL